MSDAVTGDKAGKPSVAQMFKALADMFKAIPSEKLDGIRDVEDMFNGSGHEREHALPGKDELGPFGPAEPMSGRGASKMVREYSDLSSQTGMIELYSKLENYMGHMGKAVAALASQVDGLKKSQTAIAQTLEGFAKAETERETAAKAEPVFGEDTYIFNALKRFGKARTAFRKSDFVDDGDRELRRGLLDEAASALKSAKALLTKAEDAVEDRTGATIDKAMEDIKELSAKVAKAQADIAKADKDDEDKKEKEAEDAKKAAEPVVEEAKKAEGDNSGTDATTDDEKDNTAHKAGEISPELQAAVDKVTKAAEGNEMLQLTMKEFMDVFMKSSRNSIMPPNFQVVKAGPIGADAVEGRIAAAKDVNGMLTMGDGILADSLLNRQRAAEAGRYPKERFDDDLMKAPETVRKLFAA